MGRPYGACGECAFWDKALSLVQRRDEDRMQHEGLCRRGPPMAMPSPLVADDGMLAANGEEGMLVLWPRTFAESDWCGEWRSRDTFGREKPDPAPLSTLPDPGSAPGA